MGYMVVVMTKNKRYEYWKDSDTAYDIKIKYGQYFRIIDKKDMVCLLNEQEETIQKQNQEITACYDTLTTIEELCDAVLNYDFEGIVSKVDFCNMLTEMDNKDLAFLKECFEAIKDNDLKTMTSLILECKNGDGNE